LWPSDVEINGGRLGKAKVIADFHNADANSRLRSTTLGKWSNAMYFFFLWGKKSENEVLDNGYISCPHCQKRQPAVLMRHVESSHLYFIPIGRNEGPEQVQCKVCQGIFGNNEHCAFGPEENMPDWKCFKCKKPIPHSQMECPHCGFYLMGDR
jgi:DNA-directed RNA polymerase subunit RPC12/RpoP